MKNKKWLIIGIISVLFILLEAAATVFYVMPYIFRNKMFEALKNGNGSDAAADYDKVNFFAAKDINDEIRGFIITETNDYLRGNGNYEDALKRVGAAESIGAFKGKNLESFENIAITRCAGLLEEAYQKRTEDSDCNISELVDSFNSAYNSSVGKDKSIFDNYSDSDRVTYQAYLDDELDNYLKSKFSKYKTGGIALDDIKCYVGAAKELYADTDYSDELSEEIRYIEYYEKCIADVQSTFESGDYFTAYYNIKDVYDNPQDEKVFAEYKSQIKALVDETYEKAKSDGLERALERAKAGDEDTANRIMDELRNMCGRDVDFTEIEKYMTPKWAKAYMAYMSKWDDNLGAQCNSSDYVATYFEGRSDQSINSTKFLTYNSYKPSKLFLSDIDGNSVPELILMSDVTCYVLTYSEEKVKLVTLCVPLTGLGEDGILIQGGGENSNYGTIKISEDTAYFTHFVYDSNGVYYKGGYTDGDKIDKVTYQEEYDYIKSLDVYELPDTYGIGDIQKAVDDYRNH